jgi:putative lipoic acid-binding regulatory protein
MYGDGTEEEDEDLEEKVEKSNALFMKKDPNKVESVRKKQKLNYVAVSKPVGTENKENVETVVSENITFNSIDKMLPAYMGWSFKDDDLVQYICLYINLPSGIVSAGNIDLYGKIEPSLTDENETLVLKCQWPSSMSDEEVLTLGVKHTKTGSCNGTMVPMKQKFREQLVKIKRELGLNNMCNIGTDIKIPLPTKVESIDDFCPICCARTGGMNLFIGMKTKQQETFEQTFDYSFNIVR